MSDKTHGGARPGAGRKPGDREPAAQKRTRRLVLLSEAELAIAQRLGNGNASYGIRWALYAAVDTDPHRAR
ncbi:hypothetical protein EOM89_14460 [Candidatus Falkowbacteria bacterium]|jgi:hypothetical protein|nr:hypothetical protein [Candidatus Falkowbacteria bacterium]